VTRRRARSISTSPTVTTLGSGGPAGAGLLRRSVALIRASSSSIPNGLVM